MSIADFYKPFHIMAKTSTEDGEGGYTHGWTQSTAVLIAPANDQSIEAQKASKSGVTSLYSFVFGKTLGIAYNTYLIRDLDGAYFRITSDPVDYETPSVTTLNLRKATAERVGVLPV